ncbi:MAG: recombinase family protein [Eubacteriales bacterium]
MINTEKEIIAIKATIPTEQRTLRVAAYARVSSGSEEQLSSFENQMNYYTKLIEEKQNWIMVGLYSDEGISGVSTRKRAGFLRLMEHCRDGKIDHIITKSVSRFARNTLDSLETLRELKKLGVSVHFEKEGIDTSKLSSETLITLYSNFAQAESENISKNCKKGVRMRMQNGTYAPVQAPYGYKIVDKQLRVEPTQAEVVKRIFSAYLQGEGILQIANSLNATKVSRKTNAKWRPETVSRILRNPSYRGDTLLQKNIMRTFCPIKKRKIVENYHNITSHNHTNPSSNRSCLN